MTVNIASEVFCSTCGATDPFHDCVEELRAEREFQDRYEPVGLDVLVGVPEDEPHALFADCEDGQHSRCPRMTGPVYEWKTTPEAEIVRCQCDCHSAFARLLGIEMED